MFTKLSILRKKYPTVLFIFVALLILGAGIVWAQQQKKPSLAKRWQNVEEFAEKQLPESALKELDEIIRQTATDNNKVEYLKAQLYKIRFTLEKDPEKAKNYQVNQAKAAIVHGGITGMGPGKSALKQMLPQSASDFIFAIIVEEYGFFGAFALITLYMIMMIRIVMIASKMRAFFGSLLVLSLGIMIFVQLAVNIAVAVNLIPVTGQPLPLISYGGTSMLVTYLQLGIILNVSSRILTFEEEGMGKKQNVEEINDIA